MKPIAILKARTPAMSGGSGTFQSAIMADSPYIYYRLGESSGTAIADSSGSSRHAAIFGTSGTDYDLAQPSLVGDSNTAIRLKSNAGYVRSNAAYSFPVNNCTLMVAIKPNAAAAAGYVAGLYSLTDPTSAGGSRDRLLYIDTNGKLVAYVWNGAIRTIVTSAAMNDNTAKLVHLVIGASSTELFVNGASVGTMAHVSTDSGARYLYAGMNNVSGQPNGANAGLRGIFDEVAWFNSALPSGRVLAHAQAAGLA